MLWLIMTTGKCNLACKYCGGSFPESFVPRKINYDLEKLKNVIEKDSDPTVIFYGGEPLLNHQFIMEVMDEIKANRFGIQTNGTFIPLLPDEYWRNMDLVLLSIDGRESTTDSMRGRGVYRKVTASARRLKELGLETIARMTVTEKSIIDEEVFDLIKLNLFDKIHWQLNVVWTERWNFKEWAENYYIPGIRRLMDFFVSNLQKGVVVKIIPFLGVISSHYFPRKVGVACGAGYDSITVTPDGRILSCPIAVTEQWAELGSLDKGFLTSVEDIPGICKNCEYLKYCGGRCLYANKERYWGEDGWYEVDGVTREYLSIVLSRIPEIDKIIESGIIDKNDLRYDPTKDSTEVIP